MIRLFGFVIVVAVAAGQSTAFEVGERVVVIRNTSLVSSSPVFERAVVGEVYTIHGQDGERLVVRKPDRWLKHSSVVGLPAAVAYWSEMISKNPKDSNAIRARAKVRAYQKDFAAAIDDADHGVELDPRSVESYVTRGEIHFSAGERAKAIADFNRALEILPTHPRGLVCRSVLLAMTGDNDGALEDLDMAIAKNDPDPMLYRARGTLLCNEGAIKEALEDFEAAWALDPYDARSIVKRGVAWDKAGNARQALKDFEKSIELDPTLIEAYRYRSVIWLREEKYDRAIADFDKVLHADSGNVPCRKGKSFALGKMREAAYAEADRAIGSGSPSFTWRRLQLRAMEASRAEDFSRAIIALDQAIQRRPNDAELLFQRGDAYRRSGKHDAAIGDFTAAIAHDSGRIEVFLNRALSGQAAGKFASAKADYEEVVRLAPKVSLGYFGRGTVVFHEGRFEASIVDFDLALGIDSDSAIAYCCRGMARLMLMKDLDLASSDFTKAIGLDPTLAVAYAARGVIWSTKGDSRKADRDFVVAKKLSPNLAGDLDRAAVLNMIRDSIQMSP